VKSWIAFLGGAVLAAGVAFFVVTRDSADPAGDTGQQTSQPAAHETAQAGSSTAPAAPAPAATLIPAAPEPVWRKANPTRTPSTRGSAETKPEPVAAPAQPAPTSQPHITPTPAQPAEPVRQAAVEPAKPAPPPEPRKVTIIAGTLIPVRLVETLSSDRAQAGYQFQATLDQPLIADGFVIAERGARVEGRVVEAEKAGRVQGVSQLAIELFQLHTADGQKVNIATETFQKEGEQTRKSDAAKVAGGAAVGAALGAIFGGGKGAAIGAGTGAAAGTGVVVATRGKPATLATETRISFRLKSPVTIVEKR